MAFILNINTASNPASVCLARDTQGLSFAQSTHQKDHAAWLHPAVKQIIAEAGQSLMDIQAIAVTAGPGSYTGLRIGLSAAKGLSFALDIPLISINLLEIMAYAVKAEEVDFVCPVIHARKMEVFMAVYDRNLGTIVPPCALNIKQDSFDSLLAKGRIVFVGDGIETIKKVIDPRDAVFSNREVNAKDMIELTANKFDEKRFADTTYIEPLYIKEFYSAAQ